MQCPEAIGVHSRDARSAPQPAPCERTCLAKGGPAGPGREREVPVVAEPAAALGVDCAVLAVGALEDLGGSGPAVGAAPEGGEHGEAGAVGAQRRGR